MTGEIYFRGRRVKSWKQIKVDCEERDGLDMTPMVLA